MKILILGATGMLGHRLFIELSKHHEVHGTYTGWRQFLPEDKSTHLGMFTANWRTRLTAVFHNTKPDVVINCIAKTHPADNRFDKFECIQVNAELPYELMYLTHEFDARLIHFSTDGVFSGKRGNYTEDDEADATDVYGMTKRLGEITDQPHVLTLRCCPIGRELPLSAKHSLVEWFLAQTGTIQGYIDHYFNPLTTHEIARILNDYIIPRSDLHGVYHIGGEMLTKHKLLCDLKAAYKRDDIEIERGRAHSDYSTNRVLGVLPFLEATGYRWDTEKMLSEMAADNALYEKVAI